MDVWIYLDYREDKETNEIQFECPEVYATKEAYAKLLQQTLIKEVKQAFQ